MRFRVVLTAEAEDDLLRRFDFLIERGLSRDDGDPGLARRAIAAIQSAFVLLERFPFSCRKIGQSPFPRELIIPFGNTGYVAMSGIVDGKTVAIGAIRHHREDDYR